MQAHYTHKPLWIYAVLLGIIGVFKILDSLKIGNPLDDLLRVPTPSPVKGWLVFALAAVYGAIHGGEIPFTGSFPAGIREVIYGDTTKHPAALIPTIAMRGLTLFSISFLATVAIGSVLRLRDNALYILWAAVLTAFFSYMWIYY